MPGYIINPDHPGIPKLTRVYTSAPNIDFGYRTIDVGVKKDYQPERLKETVDRHVLTDIKNIDEGLRRGETSEYLERPLVNPFSQREEKVASKVTYKNARSGETVGLIGITEEIEKGTE